MPGQMQKDMKVPPLKVVFDEEMRKDIISAIDATLSSGMVAQGRKTKEFEEFWSGYCGTKHAVSSSNGGSALEIIFRYLNIIGKDVLVPTNTFIATANAVIMAGGNPVFLDADYKTLCVNLNELKKRRTKNTVAVCVVHIGGVISPEIRSIAEYCSREGLYLIEDACHAHGSELNGKHAGQYGIAGAYSFFATKVITSTEGGMIVTDNDELANFAVNARDYGKKSQWESVHTIISMNYRMSEICAIIGLSQAKRLDEFIAHREGIANIYKKSLKGMLELVEPECRSSWYKFTAYLPKGMDRNTFKAKLRDRGINMPGGVYDIPLHLQPVFEKMNLRGAYPVAEDV